MPSSGAGLYYLYVHGLVQRGEYAEFTIRQNGGLLCMTLGDDDSSDGYDYSSTSCGAVVLLEEGEFAN